MTQIHDQSAWHQIVVHGVLAQAARIEYAAKKTLTIFKPLAPRRIRRGLGTLGFFCSGKRQQQPQQGKRDAAPTTDHALPRGQKRPTLGKMHARIQPLVNRR